MRPVILAALLFVPLTGSLQAQGGVRGVASVLLGSARSTQTTDDTTQFSGMIYGLDLTARLWRLELRGRYLQGSIEADEGTAAFDLVEGELILGVRPIDKLVLGLGPHIRSYVTPSGTTRWVFWEARARFEADLLGSPSVWSFLEGWYVLSGDVNAAEPFASGRGLEGGLGFAVPSTPVTVRLGYRIDRGSLEDDARLETIEELTLSVGIGR